MQVKKSNDNSANGFPVKEGLLNMEPGLTGWCDYGNDEYPRDLAEGKVNKSTVDKRGRKM